MISKLKRVLSGKDVAVSPQSPTTSPKGVSRTQSVVVTQVIRKHVITGQLSRLVTSLVLTVGHLIKHEESWRKIHDDPNCNLNGQFDGSSYCRTLELLGIHPATWDDHYEIKDSVEYNHIREAYESSMISIFEFTRPDTKESLSKGTRDTINIIMRWADQFIRGNYSGQVTNYSDIVEQNMTYVYPTLMCVARSFNRVSTTQLIKFKTSTLGKPTAGNLSQNTFIGTLSIMDFIKTLHTSCGNPSQAVVLTACILYAPIYSGQHLHNKPVFSDLYGQLDTMLQTALTSTTDQVKPLLIVLCKTLSQIYNAVSNTARVCKYTDPNYEQVAPYISYMDKNKEKVKAFCRLIVTEWSNDKFKLVNRKYIGQIAYVCYLATKTNNNALEQIVQAVTGQDTTSSESVMVYSISVMLVRYLKQADYEALEPWLRTAPHTIFMGPLAYDRENGLKHLNNLLRYTTQLAGNEYVSIGSTPESLITTSYVDVKTIPSTTTTTNKLKEITTMVTQIVGTVTFDVESLSGSLKVPELYKEGTSTTLLGDVFPIYPPDFTQTAADHAVTWPKKPDSERFSEITERK